MSKIPMTRARGRPSAAILSAWLATLLAAQAAALGPVAPAERYDSISVSATAPKLTSMTGQFKTHLTITGHADLWSRVQLKLEGAVNMNAWIYLCPDAVRGDYSVPLDFLGGLTDAVQNGSATLKATLYMIDDHHLWEVATATTSLQVHGLADVFQVQVTQAQLDVWYSPDWKQPSSYTFHGQAVVTKNLAWSDLPAGCCEALVGGVANAPPYATGKGLSSAPVGDVPVTVAVQFSGEFYWVMPCSLLCGAAVDKRVGNQVDIVHKVVEELPLGLMAR